MFAKNTIITPIIFILIIIVIIYVNRTVKNHVVLLKQHGENKLHTGEIGSVILKGNISTGYSWQYTIEDTDIIQFDSSKEISDSRPNIVGAESTYIWNFKALKTGQTKIIFKYYRSFEGEDSVKPENIIEYKIDVIP